MDAASPSHSDEQKKGSSPQAAGILLGLAAREDKAPTPVGAVRDLRVEILGEEQTPSGAAPANTSKKEATPTPSKGKTSSASPRRKGKAVSSTATSSPAGSEAVNPKEGEEEVDFDKREDVGEAEEEAEQEESEGEDDPSAKRAKTPARRVKEESVGAGGNG